MFFRRSALGAVTVVLSSFAIGMPPAAAAGGPVVSSCEDSGPGSLRQAVADANAGDLITFSVPSTCHTIELTSGAVDIDKDLTIRGPNAARLAISGGGVSGEFVIDATVDKARVSALTLEDGGGSGIVNAGFLTLTLVTVTGNHSDHDGGGIANSGTLDIESSEVSANVAASGTGDGGGIANRGGDVELTRSTVTGNSADGNGGGISSVDGGSALLSGDTISDNSAAGSGGGVYSVGDLHIDDGTLNDNTASCSGGTGGAGVFSQGTLEADSDTISDNDADAAQCSDAGGGGVAATGTVDIDTSAISDNSINGDGGGIWIGTGSEANIDHSAVAYNEAGRSGGGVFSADAVAIDTSTLAENRDNVDNQGAPGYGNGVYTVGGSLVHVTVALNGPSVAGDAQLYAAAPTTLESSIVTKCGGTIDDGGANLSKDSSCDVPAYPDLGFDPAGLQDNGEGGVPWTIALMYYSPAIAGGDHCSGTDQRGLPWRPHCDIGAFQTGSFNFTSVRLTAQPDPAVTGQRIALLATVKSADPSGWVSFEMGGSPLPDCSKIPVSDKSGAVTAHCAVKPPTVGSHTFTAAYSGGLLSKSSQGTLTLRVDKATLASSRNPVAHGRSVTFTARITGSNGGGTVRFTSGGATIAGCGSVALTASGAAYIATCRTSGLKVGSHVIKAAYAGDLVSAATSARLTQKVT